VRPAPASTFCSASETDFRGGGTVVGAGAGDAEVSGGAAGVVAAGVVASVVSVAAGGESVFGGATLGSGFVSDFAAGLVTPGGVSRLTKRPSSTGGICTDTSSPSGFGSFSSRSGRMTAAARASTIAPTSRRRARRFNSSTARSVSSAMRSTMPVQASEVATLRGEYRGDREERSENDDSISFDGVAPRGGVRQSNVVERAHRASRRRRDRASRNADALALRGPGKSRRTVVDAHCIAAMTPAMSLSAAFRTRRVCAMESHRPERRRYDARGVRIVRDV
jgi:hypothetical protein